MLDYTTSDHPDHALLLKAEKAIHELALKINKTKEGKQEEDLQETLKKLELMLITDVRAIHGGSMESNVLPKPKLEACNTKGCQDH